MALRATKGDDDAPVWGRLATGGRLSIGPLGEQWANGEGRLQRSVCRKPRFPQIG
jgi:hypothetical protein